MVILNLLYGVGAFLADWNKTHVLNPNWPPHARFHNGQTMTLGVLLNATTLYLLFRGSFGKPAASSRTKDRELDDVFLAALVGSLYCTAGLSAIWYPGALWADPEYYIPYAPQGWLFGGIVVGQWICFSRERARIERIFGGEGMWKGKGKAQ